MKFKSVGISFRKAQIEIPIGSKLDIIKDPLGVKTLQSHTDEHGLSLWFKGVHVGFISTSVNQNTFKEAIVCGVSYKEFSDNREQPISNEYIEGAYINSIEFECEGDFQITKPEGRTYEHKGKEFTSMTSFLKKYPSDPEHLITWALKNFDSLENYKTGLNLLADKGTAMHNQIEEYLIAKQNTDNSHSNKKEDLAEIEDSLLLQLPQNIYNFIVSLGDFEVISVEDRCYDENLAIAGTCDAILKIKGKLIAFDWKSSKSVQQKHKVQVGGYADFMKCDLGAVVLFGAENKQGYSVSKVCPKAARNCLTLLGELLKMEKTLTYKR